MLEAFRGRGWILAKNAAHVFRHTLKLAIGDGGEGELKSAPIQYMTVTFNCRSKANHLPPNPIFRLSQEFSYRGQMGKGSPLCLLSVKVVTIRMA